MFKKSRANRHAVPHRKRKVKLRDQIFTINKVRIDEKIQQDHVIFVVTYTG